MVVSSSTSSDDHFQYQNLSFTHKLFDILSDERNREIVTWNRGKFISCWTTFKSLNSFC